MDKKCCNPFAMPKHSSYGPRTFKLLRSVTQNIANLAAALNINLVPTKMKICGTCRIKIMKASRDVVETTEDTEVVDANIRMPLSEQLPASPSSSSRFKDNSKSSSKKESKRKKDESVSETDTNSIRSSTSKISQSEDGDSQHSNNDELVIQSEFKEEPELDIDETNEKMDDLSCSAGKEGVESVIVLEDDPITSSTTVFTISEIDPEIAPSTKSERCSPVPSVPAGCNTDRPAENGNFMTTTDTCSSNSKIVKIPELSSKLFDWAKKAGVSTSNYNELLSILRESNIEVVSSGKTNILEQPPIENQSEKDMEYALSDEENLSAVKSAPVLDKILKTVNTIHIKVDNRHNQAMCLLSKELFNINSNVQRIFKYLNKDTSEPAESVNEHLGAVFPLRTKKDLSMLEALLNTDEEAAQEMIQYIRNLVTTNDSSKLRPVFQEIFHDTLINEFDAWDGMDGLGTYKFCTTVLYEAFHTCFADMDEYINFVKKEISRSKWRKYIAEQRKLKEDDDNEQPPYKKSSAHS